MLSLSHKNLNVYKSSMELVKELYVIVKKIPREELYGLVAQLKRSAISVSSNIAEGASRLSKREKLRFYEIARSSLVEIDTQIEIAINLDFVLKSDIVKLTALVNAIFGMLSKMIDNLKTPSRV